jgi:hypothetical protein
LKEKPYTQKEADAASGLGTDSGFKKQTAEEYLTEKEIAHPIESELEMAE